MGAMYKPGDDAPHTMHRDCRLFGATLLSFAPPQSERRLLFTTPSPTFDFGSGTDSKWGEFLTPHATTTLPPSPLRLPRHLPRYILVISEP